MDARDGAGRGLSTGDLGAGVPQALAERRARGQASAGLWSQVLSETPSGRRPPYCLPGDRALESHEWMRAACVDIRELVAAVAVHTCSPSCFKYHSRGRTQICRHNFYHVVALVDWEGRVVWRRRGGKALRACLGIVTDPRYSDVGRLVLFQEHPW